MLEDFDAQNSETLSSWRRRSATLSQPFPYPFTLTRSNRAYIQFDLNNITPLPHHDTLDYWGCHDFIEAIQNHPTASIIYTDGSNNPTKPLLPSGSAAGSVCDGEWDGRKRGRVEGCMCGDIKSVVGFQGHGGVAEVNVSGGGVLFDDGACYPSLARRGVSLCAGVGVGWSTACENRPGV